MMVGRSVAVCGPGARVRAMRALVTGGGRGIGAGVAGALAGDGWDVVVGARSGGQVEAVAAGIGGEWAQVDVSDRDSVERMVAGAGEVDLLVANAGVSEGHEERPSWKIDVDEWWQVYEVNVLGVHLCCRAVIPGMLERGRGRIVITGSGAAYLPGGKSTAYAPSKAAVCRYGEMLANELAGRIPVFFFSPGLVQTDLTAGGFSDDDDLARAAHATRATARRRPRGAAVDAGPRCGRRRPLRPRRGWVGGKGCEARLE